MGIAACWTAADDKLNSQIKVVHLASVARTPCNSFSISALGYLNARRITSKGYGYLCVVKYAMITIQEAIYIGTYTPCMFQPGARSSLRCDVQRWFLRACAVAPRQARSYMQMDVTKYPYAVSRYLG